jgi:tetratricopeptide (TPR) repeat protein
MQFDPDNRVVKLCAQGMILEGENKKDEALELFQRAWSESSNDFEKFTSAHYVARHQISVEDKLKWDERALSFALKIDDHNIKASYPSLYLNIAKCYEDMADLSNAKRNYQLARSFFSYLPDDGYGNMIKSGINSGLERVS